MIDYKKNIIFFLLKIKSKRTETFLKFFGINLMEYTT